MAGKVAKPKAPKQERALSPKAQRMADEGFSRTIRKEIQKWEKGRIAIGVLVKLKPGRYGPLFDLEVADGEVLRFSCPTMLAERLETFSVGDDVFIECLGKVKPESGGQEYWDFEVLRRAAKAAE